MTISFKQLAVAAAATVTLASAQAATFTNKAINVFSIDSQLSTALASFGSDVIITALGNGASFANNALTFVADSATFTSAANLVETSSAGLQIEAVGTLIGLNNLGFNNATGMLSGVMTADGVTIYTGDILTASAAASTVSYTFDSVVGSGALQTGTFNLTNGGAKALAKALAGPAGLIYVSTLQGYAFGTLAVNVPEPSTYALMGLGLVGVALAARKRKSV